VACSSPPCRGRSHIPGPAQLRWATVGYVEELRAILGNRPLILVACAAMVFDAEERLLLIERADDRTWGLAGGLMEPGETTEQTVRREVFEEVGIELGPLDLLGVLSGPELFSIYPNGDQVYAVAVIYHARYNGRELRLDPREALQARFFPLDALPEKLRHTTPYSLELYRDAARRG